MEDEFIFSDYVEWPCSIEEYHADSAVSSTALKPYIEIESGNAGPAADEGSAIHIFSTQPELEHMVVCRPAEEPEWLKALRGKKGVVEIRERWAAEWAAENVKPGSIVLESWQYDRAKRRAAALLRTEIAKGLTLEKAIGRSDVLIERAHRFKIHGLEGKRRIDIEIPTAVTFDIKSTLCTTVDDFRRDVFRRGYDLQSAWNIDSAEPLYGRHRFVFLAVSEDAQVAWIRMPDEWLSLGRIRYQSALRLARVAREMQARPPRHWEFDAHVLPPPSPWDSQAVFTMARHAEVVEEWHKANQQQ